MSGGNVYPDTGGLRPHGKRLHVWPPAGLGRLRGSASTKREGRPDEIASVVLWHLSDEASYTTGAIPKSGRRPLKEPNERKQA